MARAALATAVTQALGEEPVTAAALASSLGIDRRAVRDMLRHLEAQGAAVALEGRGWVRGPGA